MDNVYYCFVFLNFYTKAIIWYKSFGSLLCSPLVFFRPIHVDSYISSSLKQYCLATQNYHGLKAEASPGAS